MRNVLAVAWSDDGLLAFVTRAAWRGPKHQVHVVDADHGYAVLAKMDLPGAPDGEHALVAFTGDHVVAHAGTVVMAWEARTGKPVAERRIAGWVFSLFGDGNAGVNDGSLWLEDAIAGTRHALGFRADSLTPVTTATGDWVITAGTTLKRVTAAGATQWEAPLPGRPNVLAASPEVVLLATNADRHLHVFDARTGAKTATLDMKDMVHAAGALPDGTVWHLEWHGRMAFHGVGGELLGERTSDALCQRAVRSPDASRLAVTIDLLELRSSLSVVSMSTGETLWESTARAKKTTTARAPGVVVTAKDGELHRKGLTRPLGTYEGEVQIAVAKSGGSALVVDGRGVRLLDLHAGDEIIRLPRAKVEEMTIDVVDAPLFDARDRPCVKVGRHVFLVEEGGVVPARASRAPRKR